LGDQEEADEGRDRWNCLRVGHLTTQISPPNVDVIEQVIVCRAASREELVKGKSFSEAGVALRSSLSEMASHDLHGSKGFSSLHVREILFHEAYMGYSEEPGLVAAWVVWCFKAYSPTGLGLELATLQLHHCGVAWPLCGRRLGSPTWSISQALLSDKTHSKLMDLKSLLGRFASDRALF
jgi:hypothetical protein